MMMGFKVIYTVWKCSSLTSACWVRSRFYPVQANLIFGQLSTFPQVSENAHNHYNDLASLEKDRRPI